MIFHYIDHF